MEKKIVFFNKGSSEAGNEGNVEILMISYRDGMRFRIT